MVYTIHWLTSDHAEILYTFYLRGTWHNVSPKSSLKWREHPLVTHFNSQMISALEELFWVSIFQCSLIIITIFRVGEGFRRFRFHFFLFNSEITMFFPISILVRPHHPPADSSMILQHKVQSALLLSFLTLLNHPTNTYPLAKHPQIIFGSSLHFPKTIRTYQQN